MKTKTNLAVVVMAGILSIPAFAEVPTGVFDGKVTVKCRASEDTLTTQLYLHNTKSGPEIVTYGLMLRTVSGKQVAGLYRVEEIDADVLGWSQIVQRADGILTLSGAGKPAFLTNVLRSKSKTQLKLKDMGESICRETGELTLVESDSVSSLPGSLEVVGKNTEGLFKAGSYFGTLNLGDASMDSEDDYQVSESLPGIYSLRKKSFQYDNPNKYVTARKISALALVRNLDGKKAMILMGAPSEASLSDTALVRQK